jgi:pimeloyl-ACP methyl ester carboxylesterase
MYCTNYGAQVLLFDWDFSGAAADEEEHYTFSRFADELVVLMDEVKLKGAVYVGHSMAGMVGCIASVRRPDLFTHLVLVGASPRFVHGHPSPCISPLVWYCRLVRSISSTEWSKNRKEV